MSIIKIEKHIRKHYNLHGNQHIWDINTNSYDFKMNLGENVLTLAFPKLVTRDIIIKRLLG